MRDLARPLPDGAHISILTAKSGETALELIRHDAAHVLATAVLELYDGVKISIGPPIENGFYYDFEFPAGTVVSEADFPRIEERMREHVKAAEEFVREDVPVAQARERFVGRGPGLQGRADRRPRGRGRLLRPPLQTVSLYTNGPFTDLCRGPHAPEHGDASARSSCSRSRAPTGAATPTARCSPASTAPPSSPRPSSRSTSSASSRPARATTASWAASSTCSCSPSSRPAARSGSPRA